MHRLHHYPPQIHAVQCGVCVPGTSCTVDHLSSLRRQRKSPFSRDVVNRVLMQSQGMGGRSMIGAAVVGLTEADTEERRLRCCDARAAVRPQHSDRRRWSWPPSTAHSPSASHLVHYPRNRIHLSPLHSPSTLCLHPTRYPPLCPLRRCRSLRPLRLLPCRQRARVAVGAAAATRTTPAPTSCWACWQGWPCSSWPASPTHATGEAVRGWSSGRGRSSCSSRWCCRRRP